MNESPTPRRTVCIASGRRSAAALISWSATQAVDEASWVAVGPVAQQALSERGIPCVSDEECLDASQTAAVDVEALRLAEAWGQGLTAPAAGLRGGLRAESVVRRDWNYYLQGLLRTILLLEAVFTRGTPLRIVTTRYVKRSISLRLEPEETLFEDCARLNAFAGRDVEWVWVNIEGPVLSDANPPGRLLSSGPIRNTEVLFFGNPKLLEPIREQLVGRSRRTVLIRRVTAWKHWLLWSKKDHLLLGEAPRMHASTVGSLVSGYFRYRNLDLGPAMASRVSLFYASHWPRTADRIRQLKDVLRKSGAKLLVLDEDVTPFNAALAEAARLVGVKVLVVVHGIPGKPLGSVPSRADRIAAWGNFDSDRLMAWGIEPTAVRVTGCPKYDRLVPADPSTAAQPCVLLAPTSVAPSPYERFAGVISNPYERRRLATRFLVAAARFPGIRFIWKYHGSSDQSGFLESALAEAGLKKVPNNFEVIMTGSALPLLRDCSLLVSLSSSIVLEAALIRRPVVLANFSGHPDQFPFATVAPLRTLRTAEDVARLCNELSKGIYDIDQALLAQEALIPYFLHARDGRAAERTADLAEEMLEEPVGVASVDSQEYMGASL